MHVSSTESDPQFLNPNVYLMIVELSDSDKSLLQITGVEKGNTTVLSDGGFNVSHMLLHLVLLPSYSQTETGTQGSHTSHLPHHLDL